VENLLFSFDMKPFEGHILSKIDLEKIEKP